jgi:hypothetical protein
MSRAEEDNSSVEMLLGAFEHGKYWFPHGVGPRPEAYDFTGYVTFRDTRIVGFLK